MTSGIEVSAGVITASSYDDTDYDTLMQDYTDMRNGDTIAAASVDIIKFPILQSKLDIKDTGTEKSKEAADYLRWCFDVLRDKESHLRYHFNLSLDYGHIIFEKVMQRGAEYYGPKGKKTTNIITRMAPIQYHTVNKFLYNDTMDFTGIEQRRVGLENATDYVEIGADNLFVVSHNAEFGDVRGRSILRKARKLWKNKQLIFDSAALACQRGIGFPVIEVEGNIDSATEAKAHRIGRTVGNSKQCYIITEKGKINFRLEELKGQQNTLPLLQWIDTQMLLGTLTQFLVSGIGANGSRAATSEHKSSYELMANTVLAYQESKYNELAMQMIDISYLAGLGSADMPYISFASVNQIDLAKAAAQITALKNAGAVNFTVDDEKFIRKLFGLPEVNEIAVSVTPTQDDQTIQDNAEKVGLQTSFKKVNEFEHIFEFESANEHFTTIAEKSKAIIREVMEKIRQDVVKQLKGNKDAGVDIRYSKELYTRLVKLYDEGKARGKVDIKKEISKLTGKKELQRVELATKNTPNRLIDRTVKKLMNDIQNKVEISSARIDEQYITDQGGWDAYTSYLFDQFNKDIALITNTVESGYTDGRAEALEASNVSKVMYTAKMDKNLCKECAAIDGEIFIMQDIMMKKEPKLRAFTPVNLDCLGGLGDHNCRCQWVPVSIEGYL